METNELPEGKDIIKFLLGESDFGGLWYGDRHPTEQGAFWWRKHLRLALQSKEEEVAKLTKQYTELSLTNLITELALSQSKEGEVKQLNEEIVKRNWGILEAGALKMTIESLEEQLKAKDEEKDKLALELSETIIEKDKLFDTAKSLLSENERLTKEVKDWMGERVELLKRINSLM